MGTSIVTSFLEIIGHSLITFVIGWFRMEIKEISIARFLRRFMAFDHFKHCYMMLLPFTIQPSPPTAHPCHVLYNSNENNSAIHRREISRVNPKHTNHMNLRWRDISSILLLLPYSLLLTSTGDDRLQPGGLHNITQKITYSGGSFAMKTSVSEYFRKTCLLI